MPAGDTEITFTSMGTNNPVLSGHPDGPIYIFLEENDEMPPEPATLKLYETGEAVTGLYLGTVTDGKTAKHLYWSDYYDGFEDNHERRDVRVSNDVPEVRTSGGSESGTDAQGQSEDV